MTIGKINEIKIKANEGISKFSLNNRVIKLTRNSIGGLLGLDILSRLGGRIWIGR